MPLCVACHGPAFVANPAVRAWMLGLAPEAIAAVLDGNPALSRTLLERVWPAGIGFEVAGFGDLGLIVGGEIAAARSIVNTDGATVEDRLEAAFFVTADAGVGGGVTDAHGDGHHAGANAAWVMGVEVQGRAYSPVPGRWWTPWARRPSGVGGLPRRRPAAHRWTPGRARRGLRARIKSSVGPEAAAAAGAVEVGSLPEWLGPRVQPQPGSDSDSDTRPASASAASDALEGSARPGGCRPCSACLPPAWTGDGAEASLSGMVAAGLGPMLGADEDAALQEAARLGGGAGASFTVRAGLHIDAGLLEGRASWKPELTRGGIDVSQSSTRGAVEQTQTRSYPSFTALRGSWADLSEVPDRDGDPTATHLDEVLASGATLSDPRHPPALVPSAR